ncbi:MAG: hypothetical protein Q7R80_00625, partial [bacterium]|nr:hypothetical protein [bacterium]
MGTVLLTKATATDLNITNNLTVSSLASSTFAGGITINSSGLYITSGGVRVAALNSPACTIKTDTFGNFVCGTDAGASGTTEINWAYVPNVGDSTYGRIYVATTTNQVVIGATGTTSLAKLEVFGDVRAFFFTATTSSINTFPQIAFTNATGTSIYTSASSTLQELRSTNTTIGNALTLSALSNSGLAVNGAGVVYAAATTTFSGGVTYLNGNVTNTLTAGDGLTRTVDDIDCDVASSSVDGCLDNLDWTTFNNKVSSSSLTQLSFVNATGTSIYTSASSTIQILNTTSLSVGNLTGPLQAQSGLVSATGTISVNYGGTGLSTPPSYGQLLLGTASGAYALTATSSLGLLGAAFTNWKIENGYLTPTTTIGILVSASSTLNN